MLRLSFGQLKEKVDKRISRFTRPQYNFEKVLSKLKKLGINLKDKKKVDATLSTFEYSLKDVLKFHKDLEKHLKGSE